MKEKIDKSIMIDDTVWLQELASDLYNIYMGSACLKRGIVCWDCSHVMFMTKAARKLHIKKIENFNTFLLDFSKLSLSEKEGKCLLSCLWYLNKILYEFDDVVRYRACEYIDNFFIQNSPQTKRRSINVIKGTKVENIVTLDDLLDLNFIDEMYDDLRVISEGAIFLLKGMIPYVNVDDVNFMKESARKSYIKKINSFSHYLRNFENPYLDGLKIKKLRACLDFLDKIVEKDDAVRFRACTYISDFFLTIKPILRNCIFAR